MENITVENKQLTRYEKYCKGKPTSDSLKRAKAKYYIKMKKIKAAERDEELLIDTFTKAKHNYINALAAYENELAKQ